MEKHKEIVGNSFDTLGNSRPVSPVVSNIKSFIQIAIAVGVFSVSTSSYAQTSLPTNKKGQETDIHHDSLDHNVDSLLMKYGEEKGQKTEIQHDSLDYHQKIITMNVDSLLMEYGEEKGMEIINEHFVIELNILRQLHQVGSVDTSHEVMRSAQKHAEYLDSLGISEHMMGEQILYKRLEREGISFFICGENLAENQTNIKQLIEDWLKSLTHTKNLIHKKFTKVGLWKKNGKWVFIAIG